jgi:hypothetical protein
VCFWMCSNERESARKLSRIAKASVPTLCEQIRYLTFTSRGALAHAKNKHICHKTGHKWYTFGFCDLLRFFFCLFSVWVRTTWLGLFRAHFGKFQWKSVKHCPWDCKEIYMQLDGKGCWRISRGSWWTSWTFYFLSQLSQQAGIPWNT